MSAAVTFGIESSNIVGYTTKEAPQGKFIILGAQFEGVTGGTKINDLITGLEGVAYDDDKAFQATAPQIQIPTDGDYNVYYYLTDGWYDDGTPAGGFKPGWCDEFGSIVDDDLTPGVAMWLRSSIAASVNVAGAVPETDTAAIACPANFALRANIYPESVGINDEKMSVAGISGVDYDDNKEFQATAPQIQVPSNGDYAVFYYLNDGWYDDGSQMGAFKPGWCDEFGTIAIDSIPAAQGFWTKGAGSQFTITFRK